jgi:hypothetical protein
MTGHLSIALIIHRVWKESTPESKQRQGFVVEAVTLDAEARFSPKCGCTAVVLELTEIRLRESDGISHLNTRPDFHHNIANISFSKFSCFRRSFGDLSQSLASFLPALAASRTLREILGCSQLRWLGHR